MDQNTLTNQEMNDLITKLGGLEKAHSILIGKLDITLSPAKFLTSYRVNNIFQGCLAKEGDDLEKLVKSDCIFVEALFNTDRLEAHKVQIKELLDELPKEFRKTERGGGWAFSESNRDKHGNVWSTHHYAREQLFLLGMATGMASLCYPKSKWPQLPGGIPYYVVNL